MNSVLYQNNPAGCFVAGPLQSDLSYTGPFVAGRFVGAALKGSLKTLTLDIYLYVQHSPLPCVKK
jgi:hypothetical protein